MKPTLPLLGDIKTDREMKGLAPEIPEDLYMLIKKVRVLSGRLMIGVPSA